MASFDQINFSASSELFLVQQKWLLRPRLDITLCPSLALMGFLPKTADTREVILNQDRGRGLLSRHIEVPAMFTVPPPAILMAACNLELILLLLSWLLAVLQPVSRSPHLLMGRAHLCASATHPLFLIVTKGPRIPALFPLLPCVKQARCDVGFTVPDAFLAPVDL